ncbi:MAG TPA: ABC transporter ATP-binding protein [Candidatus Absconditabacterales bacterium]|nr:ABC transporter ATP-binding protein [Candidatus Absconditabacterales bacterium]HMT26918.1 ABC transporter ATP-binding protein [Candidatus Absconditabacterales bacterium]
MPILDVRGLCLDYIQGQKARSILKNLNLAIEKPGIFSLLGQNGSGKTSFLRTIVGLQQFQAGEIIFFGNKKTDRNGFWEKIGYAPDAPGLYDFLTGRDHIDFFRHMSGKKLPEAVVFELVNQLGLSFALDKKVGSYSRGMRQRLGLIISLLHDPELLIRDEPMSALDPLGRLAVKKLMDRLVSQGKTLFFSTHILSDVAEKADEFFLLDGGKIIDSSSGKKITNIETYYQEKIFSSDLR